MSATGMSDRLDAAPWLYWSEPTESERHEQLAIQQALAEGGAQFGRDVYISPRAILGVDRLQLGDRCYLAAGSYVTHDLIAGDDCTVNPYAVVRGSVRLGSGVRIGAHASVLGFNHSTGVESPIHTQPTRSAGIVVDDDVWIGSSAIVLDGVHLGAHSVIGAGAVVTRDVEPWSIMAGNPARRVRDRRSTGERAVPIRTRLERFGDSARRQARDVIARSWLLEASGGGAYVDRPGAETTVRAHCDAVELADLLLGSVPAQLAADEHRMRLRSLQDEATGLVAQFGSPDAPVFGMGDATYHVLSVGYALDLLRSGFAHPVHGVSQLSAAELCAALDALDWQSDGWACGAWVDAWATAAHWNRARGASGQPGGLEALFGWLSSRIDAGTGVWSPPSADQGWLQAVNGYYRLTRGSYAQFGLPVPHAERTIDTLLDHAQDGRWFADGVQNACNVLDVAHPLWLLGKQTDHRTREATEWARAQLESALGRWQDGRGMPFAAGTPSGSPEQEPGLQGTEMWLAIIWTLAELLGESASLGYRPRGVHRAEPAEQGLDRGSPASLRGTLLR
ncbi:acyltransferase [Leifsonia sp. NPDC058230]|uniref:acyltransferase n=1 Tax=Leifsonia sp. NPDC058230 TaxID=3346391 RepID=UPI0036DB444C